MKYSKMVVIYIIKINKIIISIIILMTLIDFMMIYGPFEEMCEIKTNKIFIIRFNQKYEELKNRLTNSSPDPF